MPVHSKPPVYPSTYLTSCQDHISTLDAYNLLQYQETEVLLYTRKLMEGDQELAHKQEQNSNKSCIFFKNLLPHCSLSTTKKLVQQAC
jgi:recombinational DNA repair protein (RecF pathway)